MIDQKLLAQYGLKYNPFVPAIPPEDLWRPPSSEAFFYRVETLVLDGGFALLDGISGVGKSKLLQLLAHHLEQIDDIVVGVMQRPQSSLGDFYRELGDLFGCKLSVANRYGGFKALRARWRDHIRSTLCRPILLVDEAQELATASLNELRLLGSAHFDSECLLTTVLCGDLRLRERLRSPSLVALGTRIRTRFTLTELSTDELRDLLEQLVSRAGAPHLLTDELRDALVTHCGGNPRIMMTSADELLQIASKRDQAVLDEKLFFDVFKSRASPSSPRRPVKRRS